MSTVLQIKPSRIESILSAIKELSPDERETLTKQVLAIVQLETPPVPPSTLEDTYISISKKTLVHTLCRAYQKNWDTVWGVETLLRQALELLDTTSQTEKDADHGIYTILEQVLTPEEFRIVDTHYFGPGGWFTC